MAKSKPSVEEKRELARKQITDVSLELFLTNGYEKTTTRDIIAKAGILNGSLYNRFKSKDEILINIVKEATEEILRSTSELLKKEKDVLVAASFPCALELYMAHGSRNVADLIYEVHRRWEAVQMYDDIFQKWFREITADYGYKAPAPEYLRMLFASLIGSTGDMVGCYAHGDHFPLRDAVKHSVVLISATLHIPVMNIDAIVDRLMEILDSDMTFLGYRLSDVPGSRPEQDTSSDTGGGHAAA